MVQDLNKVLFNSTVYYGISSVIILCMLFNKRCMPNKRYLLKKENVGLNITSYGVIAGLSVFLFLSMLGGCHVNMSRIAVLLVMYLTLMYTFCPVCSKTYQYITVYSYLIPLLPFLFGCKDIKTILLIISVVTAIGRLGCMSAGCCHGPHTKEDKAFTIEYTDPEQIVNVNNGVKKSKCISTIMIETAIQFLMVGMMLSMPNNTIWIYSIGSMLLVYLSGKWRQRDFNIMNYIGLLVPLVYCYGDLSGFSNCNGASNYMINGILGTLVMLMYSNDINLNLLLGEK